MRLATPVWTSPRVKPPFGAVKLNRAHPLARGLAFFCLFRRDEPTGGIDLVRGQAGTATNAPSRSVSGLICSGTAYTSFADAAVGGDTPYTGAITLVWRGVVATGASGWQQFLDKNGSAFGETASPFSYSRDDTTGTKVRIVRAGTGPTGWTGSAVTLGEVAEFTTTYADGNMATTPVGYKNGVAFTYSNIFATAGTVTGTNASLTIGRRNDGSAQLTGDVIHTAIWSRALSAAEAGAFYAEPYALLMPVAPTLPTLDIPQGRLDPILRSRMRTW